MNVSEKLISSTLEQTQIPMANLDELLDTLLFNDKWITFEIYLTLGLISLIGILLCSLSAFIFYQPRFVNPVFYYYRLLCFIYIIQLVHGIPFVFCLSPRYSPWINSYFSACYNIYFLALSTFLFHFENLLQMAILIDRMKIFSFFV